MAYGTDVENLDFSEKIITKINEWGISEDTKVFCKIRDKILNSQVFNKEFASNNFFTFGNESEEVYSISKIVSEKNEQMAKDRHLCYALEGVDEADEGIVKAKALKKWYAQSQVQRESNTYACLSIRLKLNLLGFDYCSKEDDRVSAETEFKELYENGDSIIYDDTKPAVKGHKIVKYSNDIKDGSIRYIMAVQEHQRWTAYMITSGFVPSTIKEISEGNVKNMKLRRHGNITTFDGLYKFREIMAKSMGTSEEKTDVIRYDYQIMDDVVWILSDNGYKIVKKLITNINKD